MRNSILKPGKRYTFSDYFDFNYPTEEIVAEFGYSFTFQVIIFLPIIAYNSESIRALQATYYKTLPQISLNSEIAKRDFLIAPLLLEIAKATNAKIHVEYPIDIDDKLSGSLDYLIRSGQCLLVIEAKKGDLDKGFNQLAIELIALDKSEDITAELLYGAVTIGDVWRFGTLDRQTKHITKDIHIYRIPEDTEATFCVLMGIVTHHSLREVPL